MWNFLKRLWQLRYGQTRFRLVDINCMAYLGLVALLLIFFHKAVVLWPLYILAHFVLIIGILEAVRLGEIHPQKKFFRILRTFYPIPFFLFVWEELGVLVRMIYGSYKSSPFFLLPHSHISAILSLLICFPLSALSTAPCSWAYRHIRSPVIFLQDQPDHTSNKWNSRRSIPFITCLWSDGVGFPGYSLFQKDGVCYAAHISGGCCSCHLSGASSCPGFCFWNYVVCYKLSHRPVAY